MLLNRVPHVVAVADLDSARRWYERPLGRSGGPLFAAVTTGGRADDDGRVPSSRRPGRGALAAVRRILTRGVAPVIVALAVFSSSAAAATAPSGQTVVDWNTIARQAIVRGAGSNVSTAMVQVAVYDAVTAIDGRFEPFATRIRAHRRASQEAATAAAAHRLLVLLFPAQAEELDRTYADYLARIPDGKAKSDGIAVGERAALGTFAFRDGDGRDNQVPWVQPPPRPGVFEPTTPGPPAGLALAQTRPFTFDSPARFRPDGPTPLSTPRYAAEFDEVKELGRLESATRTDEQTAIALFWADGSISQWNRALQRITIARELSLAAAARLFALGSVAGADAAIGCWEAKYYYTWWRPVHAIPRAGTDGNPATTPEEGWEPLLRPTPNHPEYPSGHGCYAAAVTTSLAAFFGRDQVSWSLDSTTSGATRYYSRFSQAVTEVIDARVWAGIHFRSSDVEGAILGYRVAAWVLAHHFRPEP
jgi:PAP2 superfamily